MSKPAPSMEFPSKRDWWLVGIIWLAAAGSAVAGVGMLLTPGPFVETAIIVAADIALIAFLFWVTYGTRYVVGETEISIHCGPFKFRVPIGEIESVKPTRNPLSSPACSLDRLLINWSPAKKRIMVSPSDKGGFLSALAARNPNLKLEGGSLVRQNSHSTAN